MKRYLSLTFYTLGMLLVLDFIWIGLVASNFYKLEYGQLYATHIVWQAAAIFYVLYALGFTYFVTLPALKKGTLATAALSGAFFAAIAFGTYDLTSLAITAQWPPLLSVVDMSWGIFEGSVVSGAAFLLGKKFLRS